MRNIKGLILTEALVAVALLATGAIMLGSIVNAAAGTARISKNYLIAQNLATEAIEVVKNIRNTNWLRFPEYRNAWLKLDPSLSTVPPAPPFAAKGPTYIVSQQDGWWKMVGVASPSELDIGGVGASLMFPYQLCMEVFKTENIGGGDLTFEKYVQTGERCSAGFESPFYRAIKFQDLDEDVAIVEVKVQWAEGVKVRTIEQSTKLYNSI